ncbi:MbtH family protein [Streptomyces anulatus]|uniref:MbtH family protein n=1 Tax=Streptomyces anulatus TaxID=1892 RepID=UPI00342635E5|nr:MbtH family protein [Streptomyces anulatus]
MSAHDGPVRAPEAWLAVVNDEGQHSLWAAGAALPEGWRAAGFEGGREECLAWIEREWTDISPLSTRRDP